MYGPALHKLSQPEYPAIPLNNNPEVEAIFDFMDDLMPHDTLNEKRTWLYERIARLSKFRRACDDHDQS